MPVRRPITSGSSSSARSRRVGGPVRRGTTAPFGKKRDKDFWDKAFETVAAATGIGPLLLSESPEPVTRGIGRAARVLTTAPAATLFYPKASVAGAWRAGQGLFTAPWAIYQGIRKEGLRDTLDLMWEGIKTDYKHRYGEDWEEAMREDPFSNLFDTLTVFGAGIRGASLLGAAGRLGKAGVRYGPADIWRESARPGLISEGAPWMRELEYQPPTGPLQTALQPPARGPLRRGSQMLADYISSSFPEAPVLGTAARIQRANAKSLARSVDRLMGLPRHVDALEKLPEAGRTRLFWGGQLHDHSEGALRQMRQLLEREFADTTPEVQGVSDPEFAGWLAEAKRAGFGDELLKRMDAAIDYEPNDRYWRAVDAMGDLTEVSENVIADAHGFTSLATDLKRAQDRLEGLDPASDAYRQQADEIADLTEELAGKEQSLRDMFHDRRGRIRDWFDAKRFEDVPERQAWLERLTGQLGEEQAQSAIKFADRLVNVSRNPATYWRDRIGMPGGEGAEEFLGRTAGDALFQDFGPYGATKLVEGDVVRPAATTAFYSPLQKWISDNWPPIPEVPLRELRGKLRKAISPEEYEIANLDTFFEEMAQLYGPNEKISQSDLQRWLSHPMNAHNLIEHHLSDAAPTAAQRPTFGESNLLSRESGAGDYHELVYQVPRPLRSYSGTGYSHWGKDNVVFHVRFQDFMEGGKRKLLVEEIQSDWASDFRKAGGEEGQAARRAAYEEAQRQLDDPDFLGRVQDLEREEMQLDQEAWTLHQQWARDWEGVTQGNMPPAVQEAYTRYRQLMRRIEEIEATLDGVASRPPDPYIPKSPWGPNRYLTTAARRLMRYADENGVDEIIITDPTVQQVRNSGVLIEGLDRRTLERMDPGEIRATLDQNPNRMWNRIYGEKMKQVFDKELGEVGIVTDSAYRGRYIGGAYGTSESIEGPMRGLTYKVTPIVKERAKRPQAMFQRQPDWKALPKGATELLAGGGSRVHIFQSGDVSTWIHELGHVAVHDLDDADRAILDAYYAAGKKIEDWVDAEHENFARDWERYVREGAAPSRAMQEVFQRIAQWMKALMSKTDEEGQLPDEIRQIFADMFRSDSEPDIFIPHRAGDPNLAGGRTTKGIPRAQRDIGDRTISRVPLFKRNELGLMRSGLLNDDPRQLIEHANRVIMLARANQLREAVLEMGRPLLPGEYPDFGSQYVVKRAGRGVDKPLYDALESADNPDEIRTTVRDFIDNHITDEARKYENWVGDSQLYVVDKRTVDMLFKNVTGKTPGATTKPIGTTGAVLDALLDSLRGLLLYANPGFYMSNMIGNSWMMTTADPRSWKHLAWSMKNAAKAAFGEDTADPLWERISIEMGRGPTAGGLSFHPEYIGRGPERSRRILKRAAENTSYKLGRYGKRSGRVIDDSFRVAAWRTAAAKHGYKTEDDIRKLLDDAANQREGMLHLDSGEREDLAAIRDEAENLMLDFDSMTPFERTYLQRLIFLYPFLRASVKYPLMFTGERPVTAGLMGQAGLQGNIIADQLFGPRPDLPAWAQGYARGPGGWYNVGSFSPFSRSLDLAETLMGIGQPTEIGVDRPYALFNPGLQTAVSLLRSQNRYGRDEPASEILRSDFPAPAYLAQLWGRKPSETYSDRSKLGTLLRALRVTPFELEGE